MKKLLLMAILLISVASFGQVKRENIIDERIGEISFSYKKITDLEKSEITYLVYLGFQNQKYSSISDIKSIGFFEKDNLANFIKDLKSAHEQMLLDEKISIDWRKERYNLKLYDFSKALYLESTRGTGGYTTLNLKNLEKLLEYLSKIDFGKDILLASD
jgi:hypothetical protein